MKLLGWLSLKLYLFFLRTVFILSTIVLLLFALVFMDRNQPFQWVLVFISIFTHQVVCVSKYRTLLTITDLIWLVSNIIGLAFYAKLGKISSEINPWASQPMLIHALASFALIGALTLLALIRLAFVFDAGFRTLKQNFNPLGHFPPERKYDTNRPGILFGSSIWSSQFAGETKKLIVARGGFAVLFLTGIMIFSLVTILTEPVRELRLIPTQNIRTPDGQSPINDPFTEIATWGIVLARPVYSGSELSNPNDLSQFLSAVSVIPLWYKDEASNPDCVSLEQKQKYNEDFQFIAYYCPPLVGFPSSGDDIIPQPYQYFRPDLLVTVNFTTLGISADNIRDIPTNSVQVRVAMSTRTEDVVLMTTSTTLIPGVNLIGRTAMEIHQTFKNPGLSFLGFFEVSIDVSMELEPVCITRLPCAEDTINCHCPDAPRISRPSSRDSPLIVRSPEIATIRVVSQLDASQWVIVQDFKDKTFLNGLSQTGGLWAFLSGIFAAVFGSSLMRIVFGTKPVSIFGFAHSWERKGIQKAYREEYPAIDEEINALRDHRGLLSLLQDHIIDLDLMQETENDFSAVPEDQELDDFQRGPEEAEHDQARTGV